MSYTVVIVVEGVERPAEGSPAATGKDARDIARKATAAHPGAQIKAFVLGIEPSPTRTYDSANAEHAGRIDP